MPKKREVEASGELEEESGVWRTTMRVCAFHVLIELALKY